MHRYTVILLVDGVKAGGQKDATYNDVWDLVTEENGTDKLFMLQLSTKGQAMKVERYRVLETDKVETESVLVAYRNA